MVIKDKPLSSIKADIVHAFLSVSLPPVWGRRPTRDTGSRPPWLEPQGHRMGPGPGEGGWLSC